jgi:hypothetical protein
MVEAEVSSPSRFSNFVRKTRMTGAFSGTQVCSLHCKVFIMLVVLSVPLFASRVRRVGHVYHYTYSRDPPGEMLPMREWTLNQ